MPPNWQGVTCRSRSAERHVVVRAKMQSAGEDGGAGRLAEGTAGHLQLRVALANRQQFLHDVPAIVAGQDLLGHFAHLRGVETHPDLADVGVAGPLRDEFLQVALASHLLSRHGAVHGDLVALDVLHDAIVGGGRAPRVVLGLEPVDRHDDLQATESRPFARDRPDRARHDLGIDAALGQRGSSTFSSR